MNKYYKIPLTERLISTVNGSLYQTLREDYPELYTREVERMALKYQRDSKTTDIISTHNHQTSKIYDMYNIPEFIIAVDRETGEGVKEFVTGTKLMSRTKEIFHIRMIPEEEARTYIDTDNYFEKAANFFADNKKIQLVKKDNN